MRQPVTDPAAIAAEIDRIRSLPLDALRGRWRGEFGRKPPAGLSKDMLGRMIAWQIQERAFGGLDREALTFLDSLARQIRPVASSNPARCWFASIRASATPSRSGARASTGRGRGIRASRRSHAPSPARPGVGRASAPCRAPVTAPSPSANRPPVQTRAGISVGRPVAAMTLNLPPR